MNSLDPLVIYIGNPLYRGNVHIYSTEALFRINTTKKKIISFKRPFSSLSYRWYNTPQSVLNILFL